MGDSLYIIFKEGVTIPVEPTGDLVQGWVPGTWAKYTTVTPSFPGVMATVDLSDGTLPMAGFLVTGPQHKNPVELESDMWTTDNRRRPGGETRADWTAFDAGAAMEFDNLKQLQRMGSRVVTLVVPPSGVHRIYVFETTGGGGSLTYQCGDKLYVSSNGYFTKFQENIAHVWTGYVVLKVGSDIEGDYIVIISAMA
jgi:hypothetical protein